MITIPERTHRIVRFGVIATYVAAVEWIAFRAGEPTNLWWWLVDIPFSLWIVAPIALPLLLRIRHWLPTAGVAAMAAYGIYIYESAMFGPGARSTSALIFIFLPMYQWLGTALLITLAAILGRRQLQ